MHRFACILVVALLSFPALSGLVHALHCHGHGAGHAHHCHGHDHDCDHGHEIECGVAHVETSGADFRWGLAGHGLAGQEGRADSCDAHSCDDNHCPHGPVDSHVAIGALHPPASCCGHSAHWPLLGIVGTPPRGDGELKFPPAPLLVAVWARPVCADDAARGWTARPALHDPGGGQRLASLRTTRLIV